MENASKALVIAGGILLSLLILSLLVLLLSSISSSKLTEEEKLAAKELEEFNNQWEAYNKKVLYGTDVLSVVNKAIDNNKTLTEGEKYYVNVVINLGGTDKIELKDISGPTNTYLLGKKENFKSAVFKCTNIEYVEGRVDQIEFEIK